jgi:hypothetical protein
MIDDDTPIKGKYQEKAGFFTIILRYWGKKNKTERKIGFRRFCE